MHPTVRTAKDPSRVQLFSVRVPAPTRRHRPKTRYEETREWERDGFKRVKVLPDGQRVGPKNERVGYLPQNVLETPTRAELVDKYGPVKGRVLLPSPNSQMAHVEVEFFWDQAPVVPNDPAVTAECINGSRIVGWRAPLASGDNRISETVRMAMSNPGNRLEGMVVAAGPWRGHKFRCMVIRSAHPFDQRRAHSGESYVEGLEIIDEMVEDVTPYLARRSLKRAVPKTGGLATATTV